MVLSGISALQFSDILAAATVDLSSIVDQHNLDCSQTNYSSTFLTTVLPLLKDKWKFPTCLEVALQSRNADEDTSFLRSSFHPSSHSINGGMYLTAWRKTNV
jgi:hypothetical protein